MYCIVYFENLKYTSITQEPKMKEFDLVSSIGGIFGLFIGVSFVSLFEVGAMLAEILFVIFQKQRVEQ